MPNDHLHMGDKKKNKKKLADSQKAMIDDLLSVKHTCTC